MSKKTNLKSKLVKSMLAASTALVLAFGVNLAFANAATAHLKGEVNCTGSWVEYKRARYLTKPDVYFHLTKSAGSARGGWLTFVGVHVPKIGVKTGEAFWGAPQGKYILGGFKPGTLFYIRASMGESAGKCYNTWAGNLDF